MTAPRIPLPPPGPQHRGPLHGNTPTCAGAGVGDATTYIVDVRSAGRPDGNRWPQLRSRVRFEVRGGERLAQDKTSFLLFPVCVDCAIIITAACGVPQWGPARAGSGGIAGAGTTTPGAVSLLVWRWILHPAPPGPLEAPCGPKLTPRAAPRLCWGAPLAGGGVAVPWAVSH